MGDAYRDLLVWQRAVQMSVSLYRLTAGFPREEIYGLSSQLRRAGVSVASNIAEGWGRQTSTDKMHFFAMARGSNMEIQTQLVIAAELEFGDAKKRELADDLSHQVGKMLVAYMKTV